MITANPQGLFLGGSRTSGAEIRDANGELPLDVFAPCD